jgi:uncharacterized protein (TIGR02284 family)
MTTTAKRTADDINQLNSFLRGELSAVETYQQCIDRVDDTTLVVRLRALQDSHRARVQRLQGEIRALGGQPAERSGLWGSFAKLVEGSAKVFGKAAALSALEEGEDHGLADYKRDLHDLSAETRAFITAQLLPEQQRTHDALSQLQKMG